MTGWISAAVEVAAIVIIIYMGSVSLLYLGMFFVAGPRIRKERKLNREAHIEEIAMNKDTFPVSVLVPAYNEEVGVSSTVRSMLALNYPQFEVIIIDDGSVDETSSRVITEFRMIEIDLAIRTYFPTQPVKKAYQSTLFPNLFLIRKQNGGKADALNAGINFSKYPYFAAIDGDSLLDRDALLKTMKPIIDSNGRVTATGGTVRIANGSRIIRSEVEKIALPQTPLVLMQIIEYFRAFLIGRLGLSRLNVLLIISGAFGVFEKNRVIKAGGYKVNTVGEDMELIVRIHRSLKDEKSDQRIEYIQDPVCWTEAPSTISSLRSQRRRWQRGLAETLWTHRKMILNPKYRGIGLFALPYYILVELLSAIFELVGYVIIVGGILFAFISWEIALIMFMVTVLYGSLLSSLAVLLEEWTYHKYPDVKSLLVLFFWALTEAFWYRPMTVIWRCEGLIAALLQKGSWGNMQRKGISAEKEAA
ncbi:glycosyltransferase [Jeotgalibacillus sp. R-1-5s-1]|uniref:glycosyltransferase family 2 protein n=1 Tax=Jeotgalibacillus sp. R-1-5s-1 TaxID=2555897 RepID=UPI00106DC703|nr:glycosyltransferase [Jeotgalibacillus sp. R-1-5s-1]TFE00073.1 glycosyltransferase family 2 protein [Jeotgalibacillus sp. R-1-5s-1]